MAWTLLNFGKHKGKTLPQVLFADPDWFFWAIENAVFDKRPALKPEADDLNKKARNIRIPGSEPRLVEYVVHRPTGKFSHFDIVPANQPPHEGSSPAVRKDVIDMSVPRQIAPYDKLGCKQLLNSLKQHVFGGKGTRITKARCESFFEDGANFV